MRRKLGTLAALALTSGIAAQGCGENQGTDRPDQIAGLKSDLSLGASGSDVRAVNEYLTAFGYFPNTELARQYPAWRPIVAVAPADAAVFDAQTQAAVQRLQANHGLAVTGVVDQATRALLKMDRCGVPDGIQDLATDDKFVVGGISVTGTTYTMFVNTPPLSTGLLTGQVQTAANAASDIWEANSSVSLATTNTQRTGTNALPHINIQWASLASNVIATTSGGGGCCATITLNQDKQWSVANFQDGTKQDVQTALLHNIGHAIGLAHSQLNDAATMEPFIEQFDRTLDPDDILSIDAGWDRYDTKIGGALDIGASTNGAVWVVGNNAKPAGGFGVWQFNGSGWNEDTTAPTGATHIAVKPDGEPIFTNSDLHIFQRVNGVWSVLGSLAFEAEDIGVGANGDIWILGSNSVSGGFGVWKWNGSGFDADPAGQGGTRIAVSPSGRPWIIGNSGHVLRRSSNNINSGTWSQLPGFNLVDVAVGPGGSLNDNVAAFVVNTSGQLFIWSEQAASGSGEFGVPGNANWRIAGNNRTNATFSPHMLGANNASVVGTEGKVWVTCTDQSIKTTLK